MRKILVAICCVVMLNGCVTVSTNPISGNKRAFGYTWEQEVQIGRETDPQIVTQYGLYDDEELAQYVDRLGQEILQYSHLRREDTPAEFRNTPFTFRVLDSPVVNAFALPGGFIYVTRGLLAHLNNEAQLAVVLGHEIGHVAGRHTSKRAASQSLGQGALLIGAVAGQAALGGNTAESILNTGGTAAGLLFLSYGREDERESDKVGVEYASLAGYQAAEGSEFFRSLKRMRAEHNSELPSFLSTHPDPGERETTIQERARNWAQRTNATKVNHEGYLDKIHGIVVGEDPRQGFTEDGFFHHPALRFSFPVPPGFQVINQPSQVVMVDGEQRGILIFSIAEGASPSEAGRTFASQEGLSVLRSQAVRVGGMSGYEVLAEAETNDGQVARLLNTFVAYDGNVYSFLGYTAQADFARYEGTFERSAQGFTRLTDARILNTQPTRLNVRRATQTAAFNTYVSGNLPDGMTANDLAIINQVELNDVIQQGALLKLLQ